MRRLSARLRGEVTQESRGDRFGPAPDLVDGADAGGAAPAAGTGLERLEPPREERRQHLEDPLGQPDSARSAVVEVDRRAGTLGLEEPGPRARIRPPGPLAARRLTPERGAEVPDVAEEEDRGQVVEEVGEAERFNPT